VPGAFHADPPAGRAGGRTIRQGGGSKMKTRTLMLAGTALVAGLALQAATAQERGGTLRVAISQMPPAPDPVVTTFGVNWMTATVACEPLFAIDASWTPQPMLASE